ncbi:hypothetical protein ZEAMMB73_Zm00001d047338 [Zea mays]|uniref:Replication protein A 70 kDa DNA-binding subunit B/D first OB fold domain-containing protein n=1 Tax=Zea mays TaxID=4577 RepID=A0A1D6P8P8_MAIZE|nr:hypothetical protein ZEAMMB73_Zm00001d047338 [Zea mays]AQL06172.1 hypothetical protein ZEAMMB73_Zm00001d047338 [Zea mays]
MVLSDQEGNAIYAEIPANLVERKAPDIEEGGVYIISRFRVCAAKNAFKAVDGDKMIQFMFHTIVKRVMNPTTVFPTWYFNPKIPEAEPYHTSHQTRTIALQLSHALNHPPTIEHKQAIESKSLYELTRINPYDFPHDAILDDKGKGPEKQLNLHPKGSNMDLCISKKGRTQDHPTTEDFIRLSTAF